MDTSPNGGEIQVGDRMKHVRDTPSSFCKFGII